MTFAREKAPWDVLAQQAEQGMRGQGDVVEAMRRLVVSTDELERSTRLWAKVLSALTLVIVFATAFQIALAVRPHMLGG